MSHPWWDKAKQGKNKKYDAWDNCRGGPMGTKNEGRDANCASHSELKSEEKNEILAMPSHASTSGTRSLEFMSSFVVRPLEYE